MGEGIDLVEFLWMLEVPSQPEAKAVVSCSCSNSVRSRCPPAQGVVSSFRNVVGDMRRQDESTSSRTDMYRRAKIRVPEFRVVILLGPIKNKDAGVL